MHPTAKSRRPRWWGLVLAAGLITAAASPAQEPMPMAPIPTGKAVIDKTGTVIVPNRGIVTFDPKLPEAPTEIVIQDESVVQYQVDPMNPRLLNLVGIRPGVTRLSFRFKDRPELSFTVMVQTDYELLKKIIQLAVPTSRVNVIPGVSNEIILTGYVSRPEDADIIMRIASSATGGNVQNVINAVQVGGVQQVQIDVVVASVDRSELRSRGFDFFINGTSFQFSSIVSGLLNGPLNGAQTAESNLAFAVVPTQFFGALRALRTEGLTKFLSEPRVVTQTGRPAFFRSGGQQAIISATSGITGPGAVLQPFGTELEVLPIVYGNNKIWLEVNPRISAVSDALGITIAGSRMPGFTEQNVRSAVMLESGQTFAIGGLIQNSVQASATRVPVLGDIPYLGTAFSRVNHNEVENELIILVTPRLVEPLDCNQVPRRLPSRETRSPDDYELFLEGILEAPRGQRKVWNGHCYNAAYKCDPTYGTYPCIGNVCTGGPMGGMGCQGGSCAAPGVIPHMPAAMPIPMTPVTPVPHATGAPVQPVSRQANPDTVYGNPVSEPVAEPLPPQGSVAPGR